MTKYKIVINPVVEPVTFAGIVPNSINGVREKEPPYKYDWEWIVYEVTNSYVFYPSSSSGVLRPNYTELQRGKTAWESSARRDAKTFLEWHEDNKRESYDFEVEL